ncbi:MAG: hypothetical protein FWC89_13650 [Defluviitaleaceae bacterium]|nr:hypothetical protein [Defluviitaleaceae bacterium]
MRLKIILVASMILLLATLILATIFICQRDSRDVLVKVAIFHYRGQGVFHAYYFVVTNDGTFTSYYGRVRNHNNDKSIRNRNFLSSVQEKEVVILSEKDFQNISELVHIVAIVENCPTFGGTFIRTEFTDTSFYHNGIVYGGVGVNARSGYFQELISELVLLSPLSIDWKHWQERERERQTVWTEKSYFLDLGEGRIQCAGIESLQGKREAKFDGKILGMV